MTSFKNNLDADNSLKILHRRKDLDCLRAVAVLAVVLFHLDVPHLFGGAFRAGYLGVDIFFVISGYLITGNILRQLESGSFSLLEFYSRRVRRLLPAFFVTVFAVGLAAVFLMTPTQFERLGDSIFYTGIYASNFFFWLESGYFDTGSDFKPFLHTWSLAVEEQFYLTWPLLLILLFKRNLLIWISIIGVMSLFAAEIMIDSAPSAVFYLMPFRVFEFAIGAILVFLERSQYRFNHVNLLVFLSSLIVVVLFSYYQENSRMPGLVVLPLLLATALLIALQAPFLNSDAWLVKSFAWVGRVSYSLYLVHWPIIVFYRIRNEGMIAKADLPLLCILIIGATLLLYYLVERTTQFGRTDAKPWLMILPMGIVISILYNSLGKQVFEDSRTADQRGLDKVLETAASVKQKENHASDGVVDSSDLVSLPKVLVLGDSHSFDFLMGLKRLNKPKTMRLDTIRSFCDPLFIDPEKHDIAQRYSSHINQRETKNENCVEFHRSFYDSIKKKKPQLIVFSERWDMESAPFAYETFAYLKNELNLNVVVLGPNQEFLVDPDMMLSQVQSAKNVNKIATAMRREKSSRPLIGRDIPAINKAIKAEAERAGVVYIDKVKAVCPNENHCDYYHDEKLTYTDKHHWSAYGKILFTQRILATDEFQSVWSEIQDQYNQ